MICDDENPDTINDTINENCECSGDILQLAKIKLLLEGPLVAQTGEMITSLSEQKLIANDTTL